MTKQSSSIDAATTGSIQSIRSSCDRCRFHKLKCSVPSENRGSQACERCTRAKVPCIFGRRRRANRSGDDKKRSTQAATQAQQSEDVSASMPSPPSTSASISALGGDITPPDAQLSGQSTASKPGATAPATSVSFTSQPWESIMTGINDDYDVIPAEHNNSNSWEWLQQGFGLDDTYMLDNPALDPAVWSPPTTILPTLISHSSEASLNDCSKSGSNVPVHRILSLIADMQHRMKFLEQGPWQGDCTRSLSDYPVGTILHLSQEFGAIAGPILHMARIADINSLPVAIDDSNGAENMLKGVDTATIMLVLGGYMWLVRIYGVVLGHFQAHLSRISVAGSEIDQTAPSLAPNASPTLQLGELPSSNTAPDLGRIHTALGLLLGALNDVEEQLGRGGAVARNLVVTLLTQEGLPKAGHVRDECDALSGKVQSVKELLREKMGF